ncbi:hypothetical protein D3C87_1561900 [compost metagenome]
MTSLDDFAYFCGQLGFDSHFIGVGCPEVFVDVATAFFDFNHFNSFRINGPFCRSELAREALKDTALIQDLRVIVNDHREQARSYKKRCQHRLLIYAKYINIGIIVNR